MLRSSSWSVGCSVEVVWSFCMSSSCKPLLCIIASGSRQAFRQIKFSDKKFEESWIRDFREGRCTKFEVNQKNLKWVILPETSSASSDDLRSDVSWRQTDVRADVTTKTTVRCSPPSWNLSVGIFFLRMWHYGLFWISTTHLWCQDHTLTPHTRKPLVY